MDNKEPVSLRIMRAIRNITQKELAWKTGIHQTTLCHIEKGYQAPSPEQKEIIERVLQAKGLIDWAIV